MTKEITFFVHQISSEAGYYQDRRRHQMTKVHAVIPSIEEGEILENFSIDEILDFHRKDDFLDFIGEDYIRQYFGIESAE